MLAIDWDKNYIRLLAFCKERTGAGTVKVLHAVTEQIGPDLALEDAAQFGAFVKELLLKHNIRAAGVVYTVGMDRAFIHQLDIPASPEDQVANLVRFQLAQELPFAIEESVVDYIITKRNDNGKVTGLMAAAVKTEYTDFLRHVSRAAGLTIRRIGLRPYTNFLAAREGNFLDAMVTLFINLNQHELEIELFSPTGQVLFSRSIGLGEGRKEPALVKETFLQQAILQIKRTLQAQNYLTGAQTNRPQQILIAGSTGWEKEFAPLAASQLALPVKIFELPGSGDDGIAFSIALGSACGMFRPRQEQFDFLFPKRAVDPQAVRARYIRLGVAALAALMLLGFLYTRSLVTERKDEYNGLVDRSNKLDKELSTFKKFSIQVNQIQSWSDKKVNWLDQLRNLTDLLPPANMVYLKRISLAEGRDKDMMVNITIDGLAKSRPIIEQIEGDLVDKGKYKVAPGPKSTVSGPYPESFKINLTAAKLTTSTTPSIPKIDIDKIIHPAGFISSLRDMRVNKSVPLSPAETAKVKFPKNLNTPANPAEVKR